MPESFFHILKNLECQAEEHELFPKENEKPWKGFRQGNELLGHSSEDCVKEPHRNSLQTDMEVILRCIRPCVLPVKFFLVYNYL